MQIDPFTIPVDRNLAVLLAIDTELRRNPGVSLAEASMQFDQRRQIFVSTLGSRDRSDALPFGRGLFRAQLQGWRDPEALVSRTPSAASIS